MTVRQGSILDYFAGKNLGGGTFISDNLNLNHNGEVKVVG